MYPNYPTQYPVQTGVGNFNPYIGANGFQAAVPLPQMQVPTQQRFKIVNRLEDITPNDVPMDGTSGIFPLSDNSAIYVKSWNTDGTIKTIKYIPEIIESEPQEKPQMTLVELKDWLDFKFESLAKPASKTKKEVLVDG